MFRFLHCPWCWRDLRIARYFPRAWSSTICRRHERQLRQQSEARRAAREHVEVL